MKLAGKRIMVTGGAGFIGSHLVDRLVAADNSVIIVDDFSIGKKENISRHIGNPQVEIIRADIRDFGEMARLARGVDAIFHLAVFCLRSSLHDPIAAHDVNATGTLSVCQAALENNVERVIYTSSVEVYGTALYYPIDENHPLLPTNVYGAAKAAGELYMHSYYQTYGLPAAVVRLCSTYGPRENSEGMRAEVIPKFVMRTLAGLTPVLFGAGTQTRDFTYVDDIVRGIIMAAECDAMVGECVNLGRGRDVSISEICNMVLEKLDRLDLRPLYVPDGRPADIDKMVADVSKAKRMLGFSAEIDINTGLDRYIAWVRQQNLDLEQWVKQETIKNW